MIHDFCVSLGKNSKKVHVVSGLNTKWKNPFLDFSFLLQGLIRDYSILGFFISIAEKNPCNLTQ